MSNPLDDLPLRELEIMVAAVTVQKTLKLSKIIIVAVWEDGDMKSAALGCSPQEVHQNLSLIAEDFKQISPPEKLNG